MTIICTKLGGTDASNGQLADVDDVVETFDVTAAGVMVADQGGSTFVYTGSGFDSGANHTLAVSAAELRNANYLEVILTFHSIAISNGSSTSSSTLRIERNETGQASWSDVLATTTVSATVSPPGNSDSDICLATLRMIVILTAGEKTNGIDIRFTTAVSSGAGSNATIVNKQTWFRMAQ